MFKKLIFLLFLFGLQTTLSSKNFNNLKLQPLESNTTKKPVLKQLMSKEVNEVVIKDVNLNVNNCFQFIRGVIFDTGDNKPMHNVHLELSLNNKVVKKIITDKTGRYQLKLLCNKTYNLRIKIIGFKDEFLTFKSDLKSNTVIKKNFYLNGAYCFQTISGTINSFSDNSFINNALVTLLHEKKPIKTVTTLEDGLYSFPLDCYKSYTIEVTKNHFKSNSFIFNTSLVPQTNLLKNISLKKINCSKTIVGTILGKDLKNKLRNVKVSLSKDGIYMMSTQTNAIGNFTFDIPCNSVYTLSMEKENYSNMMKAIETDSDKQEVQHVQVLLTRTDCSQILNGFVTNSMSNNAEPDVALQLYNNNKLISIATTASDGSFSFKTDCYKSYKIATYKKYFIDGNQYFISGNKNNAIIEKTVKISPIQDFIVVRELLMLKLDPNNLTFILNKKELTTVMYKELGKVAALMEKYPYIRLEINIHTDSRANDNLNLSLSKKRAVMITDYLISRGISNDRLTAEGFGETQLLNKCSNGVKCSSFDHMKNRRIDFIVLED